jgi:hypothetical protein
MAKKYVNGYDRPKFIVKDNSGNTIEERTISFKYEALKEYYERVATEAELISGAKVKQARYIRMEWRLVYTNYIEKDDLLFLGRLENYEIAGYRIWLIPHTDWPWRIFRVLIQDEKREIDIYPGALNADLTPNLGYEISFTNADPITQLSIIDPDYIPAISAVTGEEY